MSEGPLAGILGEEPDAPESAPEEIAVQAEPFAAAVAAKFAAADAQVARDTSKFLRKQTQLLDTQNRRLEQEHAFRLGHFAAMRLEGRLRRVGLRIRIAFQLFSAVIAGIIGVGAILLVRDALKTRSVVIDPFETPPALAANGISGRTLASGLLDELIRIQAATRSSAERRALSNAWTGEIAIEVPETGISIDQLERALKARLGHDQHIDGDLVVGDDGAFKLTVRGAGILPKTFADSGRDLDKLLIEAGEYVYGQSQPGLWAAYLVGGGRNDEAIAFSQSAFATVAAAEKPYLLDYWGSALATRGTSESIAEALPLFREAVRLKPDYWTGYNNIMFAFGALGREEDLVRTGEQMLKVAGGRPGKATEKNYQNYDQMVWNLDAIRAEQLADLETHSGIGTRAQASGSENLSIALVEAQMHDVEAASLRLTTTPIDVGAASDVAGAALVRALLSEESGDREGAARQWDQFAAAYANPIVSGAYASFICYAAPSYQATGQASKADAALDAVGERRFVDCRRFRGDVLDRRGDWSAAQAWYAKAVELAPSIPSGYHSWGLALAAHGDLDAATAKFTEAHRLGPHWADPLKAWGDVLALQGNKEEALAKYAMARELAPQWRQLTSAQEALNGASGARGR
jgi:tetratricopeptide (TPR) repeat protein